MSSLLASVRTGGLRPGTLLARFRTNRGTSLCGYRSTRQLLSLSRGHRYLSLSAVSCSEGDGKRRPKAVIFDVGGVLAPSPFPIFDRFEEKHGLRKGSLTDTIKNMGDGGVFARMERGEVSVEQFPELFATEYSTHIGVEITAEQVALFMQELTGKFQLNAEVLPTLEKLKTQGIKTAVLTNNFRYDDGRTVYPNEQPNVDVVVQSAVEGLKKPDRAIFELVLKRLGVSAEEAVFLDDIGSNLKPAKEMGIHTILVSDIKEALKVLEEVLEGGPGIPGTTEVGPKLRIPVDPLVHYLQEKHGLHQEGPPLIRQFRHGQSNPTYYIAYGGAELVLRKKPPGKLLPSAHAVEREYRVMKAVGEAGVPIPALLSLCENDSVIGTPFYLMRYVPGRVFKDPSLPGMQPREREDHYSEMCRVLAAIHTVDVERAGLSDFGKHGSYVSRQVARWSKQYEASKTHTMPSMDRLMQWLPSQAPTSDKTTVVHGDFRLDNLIFSSPAPGESGSPEVLAVLDWELSTLGDPYSDLAYACLPYHMEPNTPALKGLEGHDLVAMGIPSEEQFVSQYCQLTGAPEVPNWHFYLAFTCFKVAAILQGVYKRSLQQQSSADDAKAVGLMAEGFAKKGWHFAQRQQNHGGSSGGKSPPFGARTYSTQARTYSALPSSAEAPIALITGAVSSFPPRLRELRERLLEFMAEHIIPAEGGFWEHQDSELKWTSHPHMEEMKAKAQELGLWNLFLPLEADPDTRYGAGLTNLEYAHLAEIMGQSVFASEAFNCSAPDTGNMEVLVKYGSEKQKEEWLEPLLAGKIRSCFAMTEPNVASSDATNIQSSILQEGNKYILNGRKWWISGAMDPRCKICIFMGKTDPTAPTHKQQSMILVPMETPGVKVLRPLTVFGYDDAPSGHAEMDFTDVIVPGENLLLGEGRGFEIAQHAHTRTHTRTHAHTRTHMHTHTRTHTRTRTHRHTHTHLQFLCAKTLYSVSFFQGRLGPGRIHHCMRLIGMAERALSLMKTRVQERTAFGKTLAERETIIADISQSRMEIEQARLLTLKAAHMMDTVGNKAARKEIGMIKVVAPRMAQRVIDRAMQAHGAMGLSADRPLAQFFAWARILRLADGPDEVHTHAVGRAELRGK